MVRRTKNDRGELRQLDDEVEYRKDVDGKPRYEGVASVRDERGMSIE